MKGFGIEVKNTLLDPKHIKKMGVTIWLYLWFLDKMTSISEEGIGKILNGRIIKFEDVELELKIGRRTYCRWISILSKSNYINTERKTNGMVISVNKAHKWFGKKIDRDMPKMSLGVTKVAHHSDKSGTSTIYNTVYNTVTSKTALKRDVNKKKMKNTWKYNEKKHTDSYEDEIDLETGEYRREPKPTKRKDCIELALYFEKEATKIAMAPVKIPRSYNIILNAVTQHKMTPLGIKTIFEEWFENPKVKREHKVNLSFALSANNINAFKATH